MVKKRKFIGRINFFYDDDERKEQKMREKKIDQKIISFE